MCGEYSTSEVHRSYIMAPSASSSRGNEKTQKGVGMLPKVGSSSGVAGDKRYRQVSLTSYVGDAGQSDHTKQFIERQFKGRILAQGKAGWNNDN